MTADILHAGFDGLRVTVDAFVSPTVRKLLFATKEKSIATMRDSLVKVNDLEVAIRKSGGMAISAHTGEYGAELRILDSDTQSGNEPGFTIDFRAFFLATEGIEGAEIYFHQIIKAFEVNYVMTQMRVSRIDFATDFLAPWFEPDPDAFILPDGQAREPSWRVTPRKVFMPTHL